MGKGKFSAGNRKPSGDDEILQPPFDEPELTEFSDPTEPEAPENPVETQGTDLPEDDVPMEWDTESDPDESAEEESPESEKSPYQGSRTGSVIFYTLYILFILCSLLAIFLANGQLKQWLTDYQLSQPTDKRDQVFSELFADPDWAAVYDAAGIEDTVFESKDVFIAYMDQLVGESELSWVETSTGLSGNKKYFIKLGQDSIASFLLQSEDDPITGLPRWELGDVDVFFQRTESATILIQEGQTAFVNGVALDSGYTIQVDSTLSGAHLPAGVYGHRSYTQQLSGLLMEPEVTVVDENGQDVPVTYDPDADVYRTDIPVYPTEIPADARSAVEEAVHAYASWRIGGTELGELTRYFDRTTDVYQLLRQAEPLTREDAVFEFAGETLTDYRQYSEELFSIRVRLDFRIIPKPEDAEEDKDKDTKKDQEEAEPEKYTWEQTLLFRVHEGETLCIAMTEETDLPGETQVLITFVMDDVVVSDNFYDTSLRHLVVPIVSAPEGRVFAGWYREETAADGSISLIPVFRPDASGTVTFHGDFTLQSMTLYALFEDATTETEVTE